MHDDLLTPAEMAVADAASAALGVGAPALMHNAGRAVARAVVSRFAPCRTVVLCGPGNNGGDGRVAARLLADAGWPVKVAALGTPAFNASETARASLVVDAVFGAGLARDVSDETACVLRAARRIVAVDTPSGVDGTTGGVRGFAAQAILTVTFHRLKPGHLLLPGRGLCGETLLADIGLPDSATPSVRTFRNSPRLWRIPRPTASGHKYSRGHASVLGGAEMTGAARMAAVAARRAGAGLVTIAAVAGADTYRGGEPGTIVDSRPLDAQLADERRNAWLCGPGLGIDAARSALPMLLASGRRVVVDADGLTACAGAPERLVGAAMLTPHAGEFARVFGPPGADRLAAVRYAAARTGAVVVLKGADTIVAAPDGRAAINDNAPPWLASAGSGDVLAGVATGLLAQGMPPWEAACAAVWVHGRAGQLAGRGLIAEDLLQHLGAAMPG